jgi:hypothetical protein
MKEHAGEELIHERAGGWQRISPRSDTKGHEEENALNTAYSAAIFSCNYSLFFRVPSSSLVDKPFLRPCE